MARSRGVAQPGSALRSGRRGPQFESGHPDFLSLSARPEPGEWTLAQASSPKARGYGDRSVAHRRSQMASSVRASSRVGDPLPVLCRLLLRPGDVPRRKPAAPSGGLHPKRPPSRRVPVRCRLRESRDLSLRPDIRPSEDPQSARRLGRRLLRRLVNSRRVDIARAPSPLRGHSRTLATPGFDEVPSSIAHVDLHEADDAATQGSFRNTG